MLGLNFECGSKNNNSNTGQSLIRYKSGFGRRMRHSSHIPIQELFEFGVADHKAMFRWRKDLDYVKEIFPNSIKDMDMEDVRDIANKVFKPSFTVYDDTKMKTISRQFLKHNKDDGKMSAWASMIGAYFIRTVEKTYDITEDDDGFKLLFGLWGCGICEGKIEIDLKTLGYAMKSVDPMELSMDEMGRILKGVTTIKDEWMCNWIGGNITVREGSVDIEGIDVPGPISFNSEYNHMVVMWDLSTQAETFLVAEENIHIERYVWCRHHDDDVVKHRIGHRRMFFNVIFENERQLKGEEKLYDDNRNRISMTTCGIELYKEVCIMLRKLCLNPREKIQLTPRVPLVTNYHEFEQEARNTVHGRFISMIYNTFLNVGSITHHQRDMINDWRKMGRQYRGSDDYGIHCMLVCKGDEFIKGWNKIISVYDRKLVHKKFREI
jgi:hypothetical protein